MRRLSLKSKLLAILILLTGISASAYDFKSDGLCYKILSEEDRTVEVTYYSDDYINEKYVSGDIEIPPKVINNLKTYTVTSIGEYTFNYCRSLTSVTIPNSVTSIGSSAFKDCSSLTSVTIPNSVTSIETSAFESCSSLTSVTIPNSVTTIGSHAFGRCSSLTSVTIPNSVTSIGKYAFYDCNSLTSVTIPNSVTSIGRSAFIDCSSLTSVTIPNSVTSIETSAFESCSSLTSVTIPNSVTSIGCSAFSSCSSLTSVTIPNSVTSIEISAFESCSSLTSVTIPNSVTSIGAFAFYKCDKIKTIYMQREMPIKCDDPIISNESLKETILYVPTGTKAAYEKVDPWRNFWNIEEMNFSGVDRIESDNNEALNISVNNGSLTINGIGNHEKVTVYDMQGRIVYNGTSHTIDNLSSSIYIVKAGSQTIKISI